MAGRAHSLDSLLVQGHQTLPFPRLLGLMNFYKLGEGCKPHYFLIWMALQCCEENFVFLSVQFKVHSFRIGADTSAALISESDRYRMHLENTSGLHNKANSELVSVVFHSGWRHQRNSVSGWGSVTFNSRWPSGGVTPTDMVSMLNIM